MVHILHQFTYHRYLLKIKLSGLLTPQEKKKKRFFCLFSVTLGRLFSSLVFFLATWLHPSGGSGIFLCHLRGNMLHTSPINSSKKTVEAIKLLRSFKNCRGISGCLDPDSLQCLKKKKKKQSWLKVFEKRCYECGRVRRCCIHMTNLETMKNRHQRGTQFLQFTIHQIQRDGN